MNISASTQALTRKISPLNNVDISDRDKLVTQMLQLNRKSRIERLKGTELERILGISNSFGSSIVLCFLCNTPGETHYDHVNPLLIRHWEERKGIKPGKHRLVEASSGSAAISFGWQAQAMGYEREVVVPESTNPTVLQSIYEILGEENVTLAPTENGYIQGLVDTQLERRRALKKERQPSCLVNHSRHPATITAFEHIGSKIQNWIASAGVDQCICALGNGTSTVGIVPKALKYHKNVNMIGFQDAAQQPGETVTLRGTGGRGSVEFPYLDQAKEMMDEIYDRRPTDWRGIMARYNQDKVRTDTIGPTSAAGLSVARELIEQGKKCQHLLSFVYTHADRDAPSVVHEKDARFSNNWLPA